MVRLPPRTMSWKAGSKPLVAALAAVLLLPVTNAAQTPLVPVRLQETALLQPSDLFPDLSYQNLQKQLVSVKQTVGTGIGAGIVLDGKPYSGFNRTAGEIGHMVLDVHGQVVPPRVLGDAARQGPGDQQAVPLEAEIPVHTSGGMLLNDEHEVARSGISASRWRLRSDAKVTLLAVRL